MNPHISSPSPASLSPTSSNQSGALTADVVVVGAGPAGSAAAYWAAAAGLDVLVVDMAQMHPSGRDKTCGDGLTPRAIGALERMGAGYVLDNRPRIEGLKLHGFGGSVTAPWPEGGAFPARGSAVSRMQLDVALLNHAMKAGARFQGGLKVIDATSQRPGVISELHAVDEHKQPVPLRARQYVLAEGVRSTVARKVGVHWLRDMVHGVAARSYVSTPRGEEPWIHSHLELRDSDSVAQPGYGWIFPLGTDEDGQGRANLGCGALATGKRPAKVNTKKLLRHYAAQVADEWGAGAPQQITSALLPMGGAVTRTAGVNWAVIGDSAALVNPLNGEGIDYGLESGRMLVELLPDALRNKDGLQFSWPNRLREEYGAAFSLARRLALLLTMPGLLSAVGPIGMQGPLANTVMGSAARLMGNLVTPQDRDITARLWRAAGALSIRADAIFAADSRPLFGLTMR
ncbi:Putative oxidoreductase [Corynebacterium urogenitale]|uniref:Oxidoreductase n=1 Tax=Corynebacterium urogenitale TaxID=2487892 RepID=A0A5J6Z8A8_9CORY|nr:geranylgeranyl reductase family protein [Corynebacterium urogenitale]QFQ03154.1 Putative oxidoreductase [Corynebacterium urogenitale]